jgi:DNA-binding XRE family transcriptional regulator
MDVVFKVAKQKPSPSPLGRKLQRLRAEYDNGPGEKKGISQTELAEMVGVHRQTIARIETGKEFNPSLELIRKLAGALHVTVAELVSDIQPLPSQN